MWGVSPFTTLWKALGEHFHDPRLLQLFGRYATYTGSSPYEAPATLMLIVNVEQQGVWLVEGGIMRLAKALADVATRKGVNIRVNTKVTEIVVKNGRATGAVLQGGEQQYPLDAFDLVLLSCCSPPCRTAPVARPPETVISVTGVLTRTTAPWRVARPARACASRTMPPWTSQTPCCSTWAMSMSVAGDWNGEEPL